MGGKDLSKQHAQNTARVLTEINPDYIRTRPFLPMAGTDLYEAQMRGLFHPLTPQEQLVEIKWMLEDLEVTSKLCFDHYTNEWIAKDGRLLFKQHYEGYQLPDEKPRVLKLIEEGINL